MSLALEAVRRSPRDGAVEAPGGRPGRPSPKTRRRNIGVPSFYWLVEKNPDLEQTVAVLI